MEFSWKIAILAAFGNMCFCVAQYLMQQWELAHGHIKPRHSIIRGTDQKFLHWQDFSTQTWGDFIGLALVWGGFWHLKTSEIFWPVFAVFAILGSLGFTYMCTRPDHKPDWGWPADKQMSFGGGLHVLYFGLSLAAAGTCIWKMIDGTLSDVPSIVTLIGGAIWIAAAITDFAKGRFDPLKITTRPRQ